jgi:hypothetical protein
MSKSKIEKHFVARLSTRCCPVQVRTTSGRRAEGFGNSSPALPTLLINFTGRRRIVFPEDVVSFRLLDGKGGGDVVEGRRRIRPNFSNSSF